MYSLLQRLEYQVVCEGFEHGTPEYAYRLLQLRVQTCRELRHLDACSSCVAYDECEYVKNYYREADERRRKQEAKKKNK